MREARVVTETTARKLVIARAKEDESSALTRACPRSLL